MVIFHSYVKLPEGICTHDGHKTPRLVVSPMFFQNFPGFPKDQIRKASARPIHSMAMSGT